MLKRFLDGLIFGAGFALAFFVISWALVIWVFPITFGSRYPSEVSEETLASPPPIRDEQKYLGSPAAFSGESMTRRKVLAAGPGMIEGRAVVSGKPAVGLKLRLALNDKVKSQWVVVDDGGGYSIPVPYGEYNVDGYELDSESANRVLAGKIDLDRFFPGHFVFPVSETVKGLGLDFAFVDPVRLDLVKKQFSLSESIVIKWHPYPSAARYRLQIRSTENPNSYAANDELFDWGERPIVTGTSVDLKEIGVQLKAGHYYNVEIEALDKDMDLVSKTAWDMSGYDFRVEQ